jgi:NAD(P)-dependent dehydrogenase (short-subunit alcohol dehydrogenase family)
VAETVIDDLFAVKGKIALVTGGTSGIGLMIAGGLVERGVRTYIVGRDPDACMEVARQLSRRGDCRAITADLATNAGVKALVEQFDASESSLDILVNNAGAMYEASLADFTESGWDQVVDLNLKTVFFLTQQLLPLLTHAASASTHASVINIGSVGALRVGPKENYSYQAAKAGLHYLTGSLARRLGPENITVNAVAPGFFPSRLTQIPDEQLAEVLQLVPRRRMGRAEDIVGCVVHLASLAGNYITGAVIPLEGGMAL